MTDKNKESGKAGDIAKNIWLAGLGAYGKAVDEAQEYYKEKTRSNTKFFDDLVAKGTRIDEQARSKIHEETEARVSSIEERIAKVKQNLTFPPLFNQGAQQKEIHEKLDHLTKKVDELTELVKSLQHDKP